MENLDPTNLETPTASQEATTKCLNCSAELIGEYCYACGQRKQGRLTLRALIHHIFQSVTNLEKGLWHTIWGLTVRPGATIREYIAGKRKTYTHPARFLFLTAAAYTFFVVFSGSMEDMKALAVTNEENEKVAQVQQKAFDILGKYFNVFLISIVPIISLNTRFFFRKSKMNYAENLVVNSYLFSQMNVYTLIASVLLFSVKGMMPQSTYEQLSFASIMLYIYVIWGYVQTYRRKSSSGIWLSIVSLLSLALAFMILSFLFGIALSFFV